MARGNGKNRGRGNNQNPYRGRGRGGSRGEVTAEGEVEVTSPWTTSTSPYNNGQAMILLIPVASGEAIVAEAGGEAYTPSLEAEAKLPRGGSRLLAEEAAGELNAGVPLSKVLYEANKFLKPIKFVRSVYTATLFTQEEDIFKPVVEAAVDGDAKSHAPTADTVSRVFNLLPENADEEELEEIDFADIGRLQAEVDAAAAAAAANTPHTAKSDSPKEALPFFVDVTPFAALSVADGSQIQVDRVKGTLGDASDDDDVVVYVAPHPRHGKDVSPPQVPSEPAVLAPSTSVITGLPLGSGTLPQSQPIPDSKTNTPAGSQLPSVSLSLDTLYPEESKSASEQSATGIAPDAADLPPPPSFGSVSFSFDKATPKKQTRRLHPVGTPRSLLKRSRKVRRKSLRGFGAYGAMHEEALLHEVDPRRDEQRRGDSDVNWGDSDSDDGVEELSTGVGGMEIDESISLSAMKGFVHSMSAEGSQHVTMDDVADIERIRKEDEEVQVRGADSAEEDTEDDEGEDDKEGPAASAEGAESSSTDDEVEAVVHAEEAELIGERQSDNDDAHHGSVPPGPEVDGHDDGPPGGESEDEEEDDADDDDEEEESSDDEETPKRRFQARVERFRAQSSKGKGKARATEFDDSSDEAMSVQMTWADEDEENFQLIEDILENNRHILSSRDRKAKKQLFAAIRDGEFERDMFADMMSPAKRGKDKDVPPELQEQWQRDRAKKAENKRKRALERMQLAADPLAQHKGGKKGRKAMLAAARAADDMDLPNRIIDFVSLEQQIRRFLADIGGSNSMSLPPADKETRKRVHELAGAFNLKSQSKGSGQTRYTTLIKTSKSGIGINERKIRRILKEATNGAWVAPDGEGRKGRTKAMSLAHHREGEVVGKAKLRVQEAPKIGESNLGFKMLAAMGWNDGDRIGLSGGLDAPLTAVMKKTKLGLGASLHS
ncbi:hypothetical protein C8Q77DRAFT_1209507 [Trametes polyzona]|nr:hypothetical protein C8Q77DRAFT_1209507 [Trametes polyzona]